MNPYYLFISILFVQYILCKMWIYIHIILTKFARNESSSFLLKSKISIICIRVEATCYDNKRKQVDANQSIDRIFQESKEAACIFYTIPCWKYRVSLSTQLDTSYIMLLRSSQKIYYIILGSFSQYCKKYTLYYNIKKMPFC